MRSFRSRDSDTHLVHCRILAHVNSVPSALYALVHAAGDRQRVLKWKLGNFANTNWCIFVCKASGGLFIILCSHCKGWEVWGVRLGTNSTPYTLLYPSLSSCSQLIYPSLCSLPAVRGCMDPLWRDRSCIQRMIHHPRRFQVHSSNRNLLSTLYCRRYIGFLSYSLPKCENPLKFVFDIVYSIWHACSPKAAPYKTSGDERSGDERSGDERSGDERSGDERSGDERSGDERSGILNVRQWKVRP